MVTLMVVIVVVIMVVIMVIMTDFMTGIMMDFMMIVFGVDLQRLRNTSRQCLVFKLFFFGSANHIVRRFHGVVGKTVTVCGHDEEGLNANEKNVLRVMILALILHEHISDEGKKKIRTSARVSRIDQLPGDQGARLHLRDDQTHDADIVIGADGAHSFTRSEMWRLAEEAGFKSFLGDKGQGKLADRIRLRLWVRWFVFFKVHDERAKKRGMDFPRWTREEGEEICKKYFDAKLTENITFADVYANRYRFTTQGCPNHIL
ncbi:hypothetical protein F4778DRAFT_795699 [Xylariomycetidae sp. FL2044]|nr:hypothetical protein F4778DRAFT_795699 [Xylariomycetidae sp. FL2044]